MITMALVRFISKEKLMLKNFGVKMTKTLLVT